jgi:hypothetical protein
MAVILALVVFVRSVQDKAWEAAPLISLPPQGWIGLLVFILLVYMLIGLPLRAISRGK